MLLEDKEEVWMEKAERLLEGLEENKKNAIRSYIGLLIDEQAMRTQEAYTGGLRDGLKVTLWAIGYEDKAKET